MRSYLIAALTTALATQASAVEFAVEANPLLYSMNLDEFVRSYNLGANIRFAERWTLAATAHQYTSDSDTTDPNTIKYEHRDHLNVTLRYAIGKGFFAGPAYRYAFNHQESTDRGTATTRHGMGGIIGQELEFGDHWYAGYSLTLGHYPKYQKTELYDHKDDFGDEFAEAFGDGLVALPERALINAEILQVGYRF